LFSFTAPPPLLLLGTLAAAALSMAWFEGVKRTVGCETQALR
jgi:hypothetical protein